MTLKVHPMVEGPPESKDPLRGDTLPPAAVAFEKGGGHLGLQEQFQGSPLPASVSCRQAVALVRLSGGLGMGAMQKG